MFTLTQRQTAHLPHLKRKIRKARGTLWLPSSVGLKPHRRQMEETQRFISSSDSATRYQVRSSVFRSKTKLLSSSFFVNDKPASTLGGRRCSHHLGLILKTSWTLASVHYLLTEVEVDGSDWAPGLLVLVVLQDIGLPAQTSTSQHKPTPLPGLEEAVSHANCCISHMCLKFYTEQGCSNTQAKGLRMGWNHLLWYSIIHA